jgi:hypothetical protein
MPNERKNGHGHAQSSNHAAWSHSGTGRRPGHAGRVDELAARLIELCSGSHSVALVYRFLLKAQGHTEETAKAEFVRFLRGELSERLLQDARRWVQEEQSSKQGSTQDRSSKLNISLQHNC